MATSPRAQANAPQSRGGGGDGGGGERRLLCRTIAPPALAGAAAFAISSGITFKLTSGHWGITAAVSIPTALGAAFLVRTSISARTARIFARWRESTDVVAKLADRLSTETNLRNLRRPLPVNLALLGAVQRKLAKEDLVESQDAGSSLLSAVFAPSPPTTSELHEANRFMKFATAAYGHALMMAFGTASVNPSMLRKFGGVALDRHAICNHTGVGEKDVALTNLGLDEDPNCPRHFVAVDRSTRSVVLAIRGTASISDALCHDLVAVAEPFCGGRAHHGMALAARELHRQAMPAVVDALEAHPGYGLVVTGHSMGGGAAALLTTLILHDARATKRGFGWPFGLGAKSKPSAEDGDAKASSSSSMTTTTMTNADPPPCVPQGTSVRCFAFAPPPVFAGDALGASVTQAYCCGDDVVPHLSVNAVRDVLEALSRVDAFEMPVRTTLAVAVGAKPPPQGLVDVVTDRSNAPRRTRSSVAVAPKLRIPASRVVLLHRADNRSAAARMRRRRLSARHDASYAETSGVTACSPEALADVLTYFSPDMVSDHFFSSYERALAQAAGSSSAENV